MPVLKYFQRHLPLLILVSLLLGVYLYTLAPGLTWANGGSDGGDLITAAYRGGNAHPTGYPLYLLLARLFQFIPTGSLAYRTNLLSVGTSVLSAVLIYKLVTHTLNSLRLDHTWLAGLLAGFSFGLAPLVWSQAIITEVYALQAFLTVLILYLFVYPLPGLEQKHQECLRGLLLGLAVGNHITTIFLFLLILFSGNAEPDDTKTGSNATRPTWRAVDLRNFASSLTRQLVWLSIGMSLYLTIPLRALTDSPVNWGNPITLKRFWWLVSGELYQSYYLQFQFSEFGERIQAWAALLIQQFGWLEVILGITGLIFFFKPSRLYICTIWVGVSYSLFAILYSADDSYVYLIPMYISFAIWIGLGFGNVIGKIRDRYRGIGWMTGLILAVYIAFRSSGYAGQVDASKDLRAEMFGRQVMADVPNDALVFVKGDKAVFTVWYFHFALNERPDMIVIAEDLLHFDWYQESIQSTYSSFNFPDGFPWSQSIANANPGRTSCYVRYDDQATISCE